MGLSASTIIIHCIVGLAILAFLLIAWRDLLILVKSPKSLGPGWGRVWALGRLSFMEAMNSKGWLLPILQIVIGCIIILLVRTHGDDERERMGLYITILVRGQEYLLLVLMLVLSCFTFPRERERKYIITTGSKPLSRLEYYLGKVVGFCSFAFAMLVVMWLLSYAVLLVADQFGKTRSMAMYQSRLADYEKQVQGVGPPPEGLRLDAERGVLQAGNFITVRRGGMQVAGMIDYKAEKGLNNNSGQTLRFLKGGSAEKILLRFPSLWRNADEQNPLFIFRYQVFPITPNRPLPDKIQLQVSLAAENNPSQGGLREHTLELFPENENTNIYSTSWQPDPEGLMSYTLTDGKDTLITRDYGRIRMEIKCPTQGYFLLVIDGTDSNKSNVIVGGLNNGQYQLPLSQARLIGFEKRDTQQIEGPPDSIKPVAVESFTPALLETYCRQLEVASWRFRAEDLLAKKLPVTKDNKVILSMYLDVEKMKNNVLPTGAAVRVYNLQARDSGVLIPVVVAEKRRTEVQIPANILTVGGDVFVDIRSLTPGHWIGGNDLSVRIAQPDSPFIWNLAKSELIIFMEVTLLIFIGVAAGLRLGAPVAILVTFLCYLLGNIFPFINDVVQNGALSILNTTDQRDLQNNIVYIALNGVYSVALKFVLVMVKIMPDFGIYDPMEFLNNWQSMPIQKLLLITGGTCVYVLPFVAIAYFLFRKQELS